MEDRTARCPTALPDDVVALLLKDDFVRENLKDEGLPQDKLPPSWVMASEVRLAGRDEKDLVVMGTGRLSGANVTTFWVFRSADGGHQLVLTGAALELDITEERWNGYRGIKMTKVAAGVIYTVEFRFDVKRYEAFRRCEEPIDGHF
jgi:hypothetical protein